MNEKKLYTLTIDPEFRDLIPPLNEDEFAMLEESIISNGCESPLIAWNDVIVDGHNRYAVCQKHGIPFAVMEKNFASREDAMLWMLRNQLGRRNLNSYQRGELALKFEPLLKSAARSRQATSTGGDRPQLTQNSAEAGTKGETRTQLGKLAGVSHDTIKKVKKLNESADDETKGKLRRGEVSVHKAYTELMQREHEDETRVCDRCGQEKPVAEFSIPSNRHGFSSVCKVCEKEISDAAKGAAEAAAQPIAPCDIPGMVMHNGAPIHVETALPDTPEMFRYVADLVKSCCESYVIGLTSAMRRYSNGMSSEAHNTMLLTLVRKANEQAILILDERILSIDEVKSHLRIQHDEEDELISTLIAQAQAVAEDFCRVQFSESAPEPVRLAVMLMASHYYENRDNPDKQVYVTMRIAFENLLYPYRDPAKMF